MMNEELLRELNYLSCYITALESRADYIERLEELRLIVWNCTQNELNKKK